MNAEMDTVALLVVAFASCSNAYGRLDAEDSERKNKLQGKSSAVMSNAKNDSSQELGVIYNGETLSRKTIA